MIARKINFSKRVHATLRNFDLKFNKVANADPKMGYANIVLTIDHIVEGVIYDILDKDLIKLDRFEGHPSHYKKIKVKVSLDDGSQVDAATYIAHPDKTVNTSKPTKEYLNHLLTARDILSEDYYRKLESMETLDY